MPLFSDPNADPNGSGQRKGLYRTGEDAPNCLRRFQLGVGGHMSVGVQRETRRVVAQHGGHRFYIHAVLERHRREGVAQVMKAPASGGTAFDRAKVARKRARAAPVTHFIAGSRQNDCTRCAKKYPPFLLPLSI